MKYIHKFGSVNEMNQAYDNSLIYVEPWLACVSGDTGGSSESGGLTYNRFASPTIAEVDLGLPSGLIWAAFNVGSSFQHQVGKYFAWGETTQKDVCTWDNYKYAVECSECTDDGIDNLDGYSLSKYNSDDGKHELDKMDDAAAVNWGGGWRMPTSNEYFELLSYCSRTAETINGVYGSLFTSQFNGEQLFFPISGSIGEDGIEGIETFGRYWSKTLSQDSGYGYFHPMMLGWCHDAQYAYISVHDNSLKRQLGCQVRAVKEPANYVPYREPR